MDFLTINCAGGTASDGDGVRHREGEAEGYADGDGEAAGSYDATQHYDDDGEVLFQLEEPAAFRAHNMMFGKRKNELNVQTIVAATREILGVMKAHGAVATDDPKVLRNESTRQIFIQLEKVYRSKLPLSDIFARALHYFISIPRGLRDPRTLPKALTPKRPPMVVSEDIINHDDAEHNTFDYTDGSVVAWEKIKLERNICGVKVLFPFPTMAKPQIQILSKLINAVKNSEHVVLESPTGTGKTAAILSGLCSWLFQSQIQPNAQGAAITAASPPRADSNHVTSNPEWLLPNDLEIKPETSTPTRDDADVGAAAAAAPGEGNHKAKARVVYLTRTHAQIRQVIDAIKKSGFIPKSCSIASRLQLCIYEPPPKDPDDSDYESDDDKAQMEPKNRVMARCRTLLNNVDKARAKLSSGYHTCSGKKPILGTRKQQLCPYYVNMGCKNYAINTALKVLSKDNSTWDIEDLIKFGRQPCDPSTSVGCACHEVEETKRSKKSGSTIQSFFHEPAKEHGSYAEKGVCPYYTAKAIAQVADFVVCPYPYIVDPHSVVKGSTIANKVATALLTGTEYEEVKHEIMEVINDKTNITGTAYNGLFGNMHNTILVFDEGHNLENSCIEEASWDIEFGTLRAILKWLNQLRSKLRALDEVDVSDTGDMKGNAKLLAQLSKATTRLISFIKALLAGLDGCVAAAEAAAPTSKPDPFDKSHATERVVHSWDRYDHAVNPLGGAAEFIQKFELNIVKVYIMYCSMLQLSSQSKALSQSGIGSVEDFRFPLEYMLAVMVLLCHRPECYSVLILASNENRYSLGLWLMNPAAMFSELSLNARSIVIASGTLAPIPAMVASLGSEFEARLKGNIISATQTLSRDQFAVYMLTSFANTRQEVDAVECNFRKLKERAFLVNLGNAIASLLEVLPGGTLVFFPNRASVNKCLEIWRSAPFEGKSGAPRGLTILDRIMQCKQKNLYQEPTEAAQFAHMLKELQAQETFILLAVFRSHASEGLNLKLSSLILVGLPFPSIVAPKVDMARRYHKANAEPYNWYLRETYRAVNQSIGRCIRTKHDRGVVILMDRRYTRDREYLPSWTQPYSQIHQAVESVKHEISTNFTF